MFHSFRWLTWAVVALLVCAHAQGAQGSALNFRVWLGDREIGRHTFTVLDSDRETSVLSEVAYKVKVMFLTVYDYVHRAEELWRGNCLVSLSSSTVENGDQTMVDAQRSIEGLEVTRDGVRSIEDETCVGTYAYWDLSRIQRDTLMNSQTGSLDQARVTRIGESAIPRLDADGLEYEIVTEEATIKLWYSQEGQWLALQTIARGRPLVYLNEALLD